MALAYRIAMTFLFPSEKIALIPRIALSPLEMGPCYVQYAQSQQTGSNNLV
jgi:hypothetical protein